MRERAVRWTARETGLHGKEDRIAVQRQGDEAVTTDESRSRRGGSGQAGRCQTTREADFVDEEERRKS